MSASEKLKALDAIARGPQTYGPEPLEYEEASGAVMDALPLIADVVEAAETYRVHEESEPYVHLVEHVEWESLLYEKQSGLDQALTALREHLEGTP